MRRFKCSCGNELFFENSVCVKCKRDVGWCPHCRFITDVKSTDDGGFTCSTCGEHLVKCTNYASFNVCNHFVAGQPPQGEQGKTSAGVLCDACRFNRVIPDLSVPGNKEKWYRLESAKRRVLYDLDLLGFPYGNNTEGIPKLAFDFKADIVPTQKFRGMTGGQKVFTGHDNGVITINIQEADDVFRETLRVNMGEAQRSLLGHFRHEFGHYIWDAMVKGKREPECIAIFGDHNNPPYDAALKGYYKDGPKPNWLTNYVSAYATMHPWEDFAETFAVYVDGASALDTAWHGGLWPEPNLKNVDEMIESYRKLGVALNEMNRNNGLLDFLPEVIAEPIRVKLRFIHSLANPVRADAPPQAAAAVAV